MARDLLPYQLAFLRSLFEPGYVYLPARRYGRDDALRAVGIDPGKPTTPAAYEKARMRFEALRAATDKTESDGKRISYMIVDEWNDTPGKLTAGITSGASQVGFVFVPGPPPAETALRISTATMIEHTLPLTIVYDGQQVPGRYDASMRGWVLDIRRAYASGNDSFVVRTYVAPPLKEEPPPRRAPRYYGPYPADPYDRRKRR